MRGKTVHRDQAASIPASATGEREIATQFGQQPWAESLPRLQQRCASALLRLYRRELGRVEPQVSETCDFDTVCVGGAVASERIQFHEARATACEPAQ